MVPHLSVFTPITDDDIRPVLDQFNLGKLVSLRGISEGVTNTIYRLITESGVYIVTLVEDQQSPESLLYLIDLLKHLSKKGYPCPHPVADKKGHFLHTLKARPLIFVTQLEGDSPPHPNAHQCTTVGHYLAKLHLMGEGFPKKRPNTMGLNQWRTIFNSISTPLKARASSHWELMHETLQYLEAELPGCMLPRGICHTDLFPDNTLFLNGRLSGIIDLYSACSTWLIYDVAVTINAWCFSPNGEFDITLLDGLWHGYQHVRPITTVERNALRMMLMASSLRFSLTRYRDALFPRDGKRVTQKPPEAFIQILQFHQNHDLLSTLPM